MSLHKCLSVYHRRTSVSWEQESQRDFSQLSARHLFGTYKVRGHERRGYCAVCLVMPLFPCEMMFALIITMTVGTNEAPRRENNDVIPIPLRKKEATSICGVRYDLWYLEKNCLWVICRFRSIVPNNLQICCEKNKYRLCLLLRIIWNEEQQAWADPDWYERHDAG